MSTSASKALLDTLIDDAAIFPPGNAQLPAAVEAHRRHTGSWYGSLVGAFLVSDVRLPDLTRLLEHDEAYATTALPCTIVVSGGAGAIEPALTWAERCDRLALRGVEIAVREGDDLARGVRRVSTVLDVSLPEGVDVWVELPANGEGGSWSQAADAVAESGYRLKFRTGGETAEAHPDPRALAAALTAAVDREVAFKCTAGLHHAIRNTEPGTGFERHGFLNVVLATHALLERAGTEDVAQLLETLDADAVVAACADIDVETASRVRRWFTSFGSCSIDDPVGDLVELGLLHSERSDSVEAGR